VCATVALPYRGQVLHAVTSVNDCRPTYVLATIWWSLESDGAVLALSHRQLRRRFPAARIIYLANTSLELSLLRRLGFEAEFVNHNAFVDERTFFPILGERKAYRAIYNAALRPYKRHWLAAQVDRLALISYSPSVPDAYTTQLRLLLRGATWVNDGSSKGTEWVSARAVRRHLNRAECGLCLSFEEGAMYASCEYLFCGLPIVTTKSCGGRDEFFRNEYVTMCEDTPEAVRDAVDQATEGATSATTIRACAMEIAFQHRARYRRLLEQIFETAGYPMPPRLVTRPLGCLYRWRTMREVEGLVRGKSASSVL
jgi:glycosyltransferase involved in cell wall biosynthesis